MDRCVFPTNAGHVMVGLRIPITVEIMGAPREILRVGEDGVKLNLFQNAKAFMKVIELCHIDTVVFTVEPRVRPVCRSN